MKKYNKKVDWNPKTYKLDTLCAAVKTVTGSNKTPPPAYPFFVPRLLLFLKKTCQGNADWVANPSWLPGCVDGVPQEIFVQRTYPDGHDVDETIPT